MNPFIVMALLYFTGTLFAACGAFLVWWTGRIAERFGREAGYERGKEDWWMKGQEAGQIVGRCFGKEAGWKDGYEQGRKDAQPLRASNGWFVGKGK